MVRNILITGFAEPFTCGVNWTVQKAEMKIRSGYVLVGGAIVRDAEVTAEEDFITDDGANYEFVNFRIVTNAEAIAAATRVHQVVYYSVKAELDNTTNDAHALLDFYVPPLPIAGITLPENFEGALQIEVDRNQYDETFARLVGCWMDQMVTSGEAGIISRDDGILKLLYHLGGLNSSSRDILEMSTTRNDRTDLYNGVPLVLTEEKDQMSIHQCIQELCRKFQWIPHFQNLPFIFGIAINRTQICFGKLIMDGSFRPFSSISLDNNINKIKAVVIIIKMAKVLKYFTTNLMNFAIPDIPISGSNWVKRNDKCIRIGLKFVEQKFEQVQNERYLFLKIMYQQTQHVPHKEKLYDRGDFPSFVDEQRIIRLQPVGLRQNPTTISSAKHCLRAIIKCLRNFHKAGFVHCDIRWPNIIYVNGEWVLIDFTLATSLGDNARLVKIANDIIRPAYVFRSISPWTTRHDYYQVGKLMEELPFLYVNHEFQDVMDVLLHNDQIHPKALSKRIKQII